MWQIVRSAAAAVAFLAGMSLIACAQSGSAAGAAGSTAGAGPSGVTAGGGLPASRSPANRGAQGPDASTAGGDSIVRCNPAPPYTSLPYPPCPPR